MPRVNTDRPAAELAPLASSRGDLIPPARTVTNVAGGVGPSSVTGCVPEQSRFRCQWPQCTETHVWRRKLSRRITLIFRTPSTFNENVFGEPTCYLCNCRCFRVYRALPNLGLLTRARTWSEPFYNGASETGILIDPPRFRRHKHHSEVGRTLSIS